MTELVVVRHGETDWNAEGRMQGHEDVELNAKGIRQSQAIAARLAGDSFAALYSSDLKRAYQTAQYIAGIIGCDIISDNQLRERHLGILQGFTKEEALQRFPEVYSRFLGGDPDYVIPEGESRRQKYQRSVACLKEITRRHPDDRVLVVTHGGVLIDLVRLAFGLPLTSRVTIKLFNAGINCFHVENDQWKLVTWGEICHLREISAADEL